MLKLNIPQMVLVVVPETSEALPNSALPFHTHRLVPKQVGPVVVTKSTSVSKVNDRKMGLAPLPPHTNAFVSRESDNS